jgi:hypothetical protein
MLSLLDYMPKKVFKSWNRDQTPSENFS